MFITTSEVEETAESGGEGKLVTAKLSSSSKSSKLSLTNSSSSANETTLCLLSPLYTTLSAVVVVNATNGLNSSSESDSSSGSKAGIAVCVSSNVHVKEGSTKTGVCAAPVSANLCSSSSKARVGKGGNSLGFETMATDSPDPTVRCRGSQQSKLDGLEGCGVEQGTGEGEGERDGQEILAEKSSGSSSWLDTDAGWMKTSPTTKN